MSTERDTNELPEEIYSTVREMDRLGPRDPEGLARIRKILAYEWPNELPSDVESLQELFKWQREERGKGITVMNLTELDLKPMLDEDDVLDGKNDIADMENYQKWDVIISQNAIISEPDDFGKLNLYPSQWGILVVRNPDFVPPAEWGEKLCVLLGEGGKISQLK